ncbi:hypothetical protein LZC95_19430 [Pendulispora brunnea]|uniref:Stc1 domain-containing protein n=1 Tax=Pendulispora brunnea TaxID=2905690 RepID=A0ABZ2KPQ1_9BACT
MKTVDFVPEEVECSDLRPEDCAITLLVVVSRCAGCRRPMVPLHAQFRGVGHAAEFARQAVRANFPIQDRLFRDESGHLQCADCAAREGATFVCALCGARRSLSEVKEEFGTRSREFLCKPCYATVPAVEWVDKCTELRNAHRAE